MNLYFFFDLIFQGDRGEKGRDAGSRIPHPAGRIFFQFLFPHGGREIFLGDFPFRMWEGKRLSSHFPSQRSLCHFSWFLILMRSHLLIKMLRFICLCLIVCLYKNILLFFSLNCMLNEIYFCLNYKTWKRWNFVMIFELSKYRIFVFFHFRKAKSLFLFCCCWCYTVISIN